MIEHKLNADQNEQGMDEWVILELMGHRRLAGRLREVEVAGNGFLRLDVPETDGTPAVTQYYRPGAVYCITPTSQEIARSIAGGWQPPVSRFELPSRPDQDDETRLPTAAELIDGPF